MLTAVPKEQNIKPRWQLYHTEEIFGPHVGRVRKSQVQWLFTTICRQYKPRVGVTMIFGSNGPTKQYKTKGQVALKL